MGNANHDANACEIDKAQGSSARVPSTTPSTSSPPPAEPTHPKKRGPQVRSEARSGEESAGSLQTGKGKGRGKGVAPQRLRNFVAQRPIGKDWFKLKIFVHDTTKLGTVGVAQTHGTSPTSLWPRGVSTAGSPLASPGGGCGSSASRGSSSSSGSRRRQRSTRRSRLCRRTLAVAT
jgi:hypothetical protein